MACLGVAALVPQTPSVSVGIAWCLGCGFWQLFSAIWRQNRIWYEFHVDPLLLTTVLKVIAIRVLMDTFVRRMHICSILFRP